jgi:hypothetical protein
MNLTRLLRTLAADSEEKPASKKRSNPSVASLHKGIMGRIKNKKDSIYYDDLYKDKKSGKVLHSGVAVEGRQLHLQQYLKNKGFNMKKEGNDHEKTITHYTHPNGVQVRHSVKIRSKDGKRPLSVIKITKNKS